MVNETDIICLFKVYFSLLVPINLCKVLFPEILLSLATADRDFFFLLLLRCPEKLWECTWKCGHKVRQGLKRCGSARPGVGNLLSAPCEPILTGGWVQPPVSHMMCGLKVDPYGWVEVCFLDTFPAGNALLKQHPAALNFLFIIWVEGSLLLSIGVLFCQ